MKYARDAIPDYAISLSEAFKVVYEAAEAQPEILQQHLDQGWLEHLNRIRERERQEPGANLEELNAWYADRGANILLRQAMEDRKLNAYVLHPKSGENQRLYHEGWIRRSWAEANSNIPASGILSDFVRADAANVTDSPFEFVYGPEGSEIPPGTSRPVFLRSDEFRKWFSRMVAPEKRVGRPAGSGSYMVKDVPIVQKMRDLIQSGKATSVDNAALQLASEAFGGGTLDSKQRRLARRYRELYPD